MGKVGKIIVFILVAFVLVIIATVMKEAGAGAVLSIAAVAVLILYRAMFKKSKPAENEDDNEITLRK